jgi:predicted phage terminase large subunit-like protein
MDLSRLSDEDTARALELIASLRQGEGLADFIRRVSPHHPPPPHVLPLIRALERAREKPLRLCVSMPPRHVKTVTLMHALAWWIQTFPADMNAYVSYSDTIALSKSRMCRQIAGIAGCDLGGLSDAAGEWTTRSNGGLVAAGAGAGITGRGIQGLMVVDDPYKGREDADSPVIREKVWETFNEVCITRLEGASVIVCHTRWHEDDLIGRLVKQGGWEYLNFAALAEPGDPFDRAEGESLWPDNPNFTTAALNAIRDQIGEWSFAALYQGQPRPRGHVLFGPESYCDAIALNGHRVVIYADPAASKKTTADYGAMMAMAIKGRKEQQTAVVLEVLRRQMTVPEFAREARSFQQRHGNAPMWVEAVGGFKAVPQILREVDPGIKIHEHQPVGDKFQRAQPVAAAWNQGRVVIPRGVHWVPEFIREVQAFTGVNDPHDDQVDVLSGCWNAGSIVAPSYSARQPNTFHTARR